MIDLKILVCCNKEKKHSLRTYSVWIDKDIPFDSNPNFCSTDGDKVPNKITQELKTIAEKGKIKSVHFYYRGDVPLDVQDYFNYKYKAFLEKELEPPFPPEKEC